MALSDFESRDMIESMRQKPTSTSLFSTWFVKTRTTHATANINLDKVNGVNAVARYTNRRGGSNKISRSGFSNVAHVAPYVYEEFVLTPTDLDERVPDTTVYDYDPADAEADVMAEALATLEERLDILEELQITESMQTGKVTVSGDGVEYEVDYGMAAANLVTLSGGAEWDESTSNKRLNLRTWAGQIEDSGAPTPTMLIGDVASMVMLMDDEEIQALMDKRNISVGEINPLYNPEQRVTYIGTFRDAGVNLQLYSYNGEYKYIDGSGVLQSGRFMNANTVIMTSPYIDYRFHFGKIENFKAADFRGRRFPLYYEDNKGKVKGVTMESSPLAGFHQPDGVVAAVVA